MNATRESAGSPTPVASALESLQRRSALVGGVASALLLVGLFLDRDQFFQSYLTAFLYWLAPALGSLAIVMLHNMTGGKWGFAIRRLLEAAMRTLPVMALLFLPVLLGMGSLYEWTQADVVDHDPILQRKEPYLNTGFFVARAVVFFAVWIGLSRLMLRQSERYDRTFSIDARRKLKILSGFGLAAYVLTMSFASFDWAMSLEPHWFSSIYGIHFVIGQGLATLCVATFVASRLARHEPFSRWLDESHFHDLGNLMLAFVMLWAYVSFSQFLIVWSGNLPEETPWYLHRTGHGWQAVALLLVAFHFAVPFLILLLRRNKQLFGRLAVVAVWVLAFRYLDFFWLVAPAKHHHGLHVSWMDVVAPVALGGIWVHAFVRSLRDRPLVSLQDGSLLAQLEEAPST